MGISTRNSENLRKQLKVVKLKKNAEINRKEKTTQEKLTVQLEEIHQNVLAKEGRLKRYRQRVKQYRQNKTFQNNERKFYRQFGGDEIHTDLLRTTLKKVSNRKTPSHDGKHGFWFKKFTSIHDRLVLETNKCLQTAHVPEWMTKRRTTLIQKDPNKGTAPNNYRPITCLPMTWKILTAQIGKRFTTL